MGLILLWSIRLSVHIGSRHKGEDWRYKIIKNRWAHRGYFGRTLSAYLYVFVMQGLFSLINNASAIYIMRYMNKKNTAEGIIFGLELFHLAGLTVWLTGFFFEVIGDK